MANTVEGTDYAGQQPFSVPGASAQGDSPASGGVVAQASVLAKKTLVCEIGTPRWRAFTAMAEPCRTIAVMVKGLQHHVQGLRQFHNRHGGGSGLRLRLN